MESFSASSINDFVVLLYFYVGKEMKGKRFGSGRGISEWAETKLEKVVGWKVWSIVEECELGIGPINLRSGLLEIRKKAQNLVSKWV